MPISETPFDRAHRWTRTGDSAWEGEVTEDWMQGRGAFGGLQAAVAMRAFESLVEPARIARTLAVHFAAPLQLGPARFEGSLERSGGNVSHASGRIVQHDQPVALMLATFGRPRDHWLTIPAEPAPVLRPPRPIRVPQGPGVPAFTRHVEMDLVEGGLYAGRDEARFSGWVRFIESSPVDPPLLAAIADIWPPATVAMMKTPRPSSSVDLTYDFFGLSSDVDQVADGFFSFSAHSPTASGGYCEERGSLWAPNGELAVRVRQLRAIF